MFACLLSRSSPSALLDVARGFSPRIERHGEAVLLDISGLGRIVGDPPAVGRELAREARARGIDASIAIAATATAARLLGAACLMPGAWCERVPGAWRVPGASPVIVVPRGEERAAVATLPLDVLAGFGLSDHLPTFGRWGLKTLGDVAALAPADLHARFGPAGLVLHRIACGRDDGPLVPHVDAARFEASMDLEWPIDALEPLSFVLARLFDPLSVALEQADRSASAIELSLTLVTREVVTRRLELPAPIRDARTFRTLLVLQLESQPVADAIDRVSVLLEPTPARIIQYSLLERAVPSPETLSTLVARLEAVMGAGRVGAPALIDSHEPGAFEMRPFACAVRPDASVTRDLKVAEHSGVSTMPDLKVGPTGVLRRFRLPVPARVAMEHGRPARVTTARRNLAGGRVLDCAGPWRSSGGWWRSSCRDVETDAATTAPSVSEARQVVGMGPQHKWNKDEWDVALPDGVYRIYRDRDSNQWFLEGILD
jgi:protein ImuB